MFIRFIYILSLLSISLLSFSAEELISDDDFYVDEYSENRFFFTLEALLGGNTLETIYDNGESDSIRAGSGVYLALGTAHLVFNKSMDLGVKGGILLDQVTAKNDLGKKSTLSFTRYPIDLFSHFWLGRHIVGGGISYHLNPVFKSDAVNQDTHYDDALGGYVEYLYHFVNTGTALGVKYMFISYKEQNTGEETNGNGIGITFSQMF